jgi:GNAT superfamily N-acetyltransferase
MSLHISAPTALTASHRLDLFSCGESVLDDWLKRRAMANQITGASRTFVAVDPEQRVLAYYAMAAGAVSHVMATGSVRRNMPDPIPVMVLGRLAVATQAQGCWGGGARREDAGDRAGAGSHNAGVRALLVHAIHERAKTFYAHYGFEVSPMHPMTLMLRLHQGTL